MTRTIIRAGRLIDGSGAPPLIDPVVVLDGSRIAAVFQGAVPENWDGAAGASVLEYPDATLLPGLIDCHVHLNLPGDGTPFPLAVEEPDGVLVAISVRNAQTALAAGITTLRDCGGRGATTFDVRRAIDRGYVSGPRLVLCGQPITITGGHCWYFGGEADGVDALRHKVRELAKMGADFIKVMGTGGGTPGTMSWQPSFSREELDVLAQEAHSLLRKVSIHCLCGEALLLAAAVGADHIEHAWFITDEAGNQRYMPEAVDALARSGARVSATLAVGYHSIKALAALERRSPDEQAALDRWRSMMDDNLSHFNAQVKAGVQFVAGTDAGWGHTPYTAVVDEMELMHQGGLSSMEAIVAATSRAASALAIDGDLGLVREGMVANLIAVAGNPLDDLRNLEKVQLVMKNGTLVSDRA
ncbi:MAG: Imidazolonepropionase [Chloroflexi bacterium]|nr:Imidazolonepropionase [Chloroflexota bacterium]